MDRFEKMVERAAIDGNGCRVVIDDDAVAILRRQHAAMVRMVKKHWRNAPAKCDQYVTYRFACKDLLTALAQYKKGTH